MFGQTRRRAETRTSASRRTLLRLVIAMGIASCLASATSVAEGSNHRSSHTRVLVRRFVEKNIGADVRTRSGEAVIVPPGVMSRSGFVTISALGRHVFDVHIGPHWHGTVGVTIPLIRRSDTIVHRVGDVWLTEGTHVGDRVVWVTQLSPFTTLVSKIKSKVTGSLCLTFDLQELEQCVLEKVGSWVDGKVISWIEARLPSGCNAQLAEAGVTSVKGGPAGIVLSVLKAAFSGSCVGSAGEYYVFPTGPSTTSPGQSPIKTAPTPTPTPTPTTTPTPTPTPTPLSAGEFSVINASGGIYWRSGPDWNTAEAVAGNGFYPGTVISVSCYQSGAANVPGSTDSMWEQASWASGPGSGHGWINEHFINDGSAINQPSPGVPPCSSSPPPPPPAPQFSVINASGGIYWRSGPDWNTAEAVAGNGFYPGTVISVSCYQSGAANVPGSTDSMWEQASWASGPGSGHGWINEHFINDGSAINQPSPGVPPC